MCLIALAIQPTPDLALLLAGNRDEALDRPTLPLHSWTTPNGTPVVGGRDQRDGGTWLAATGPDARQARVAMLTNVRQGRDTTRWPRSRGELPLLWLDGMAWPELIGQLDASAYGPFNLVVGDLNTHQWHWLTNRNGQHHTVWHTQPLQPGVYGLSNAALNTPWPKTVALRNALQTAMTESPDQVDDPLWACLANPHVWPDDQLPHTQVPLDWERALSAIWVDHPATGTATAGYGTRTSALLSVSRHSQGLDWAFQERTWRPAAQAGLRVQRWSSRSSAC